MLIRDRERDREYASTLDSFDQRLLSIEGKMDTLLERGELESERINEIKEHLRDNNSMLNKLSKTFRKRIKQQQCYLMICATMIVLLLFWLVARV